MTQLGKTDKISRKEKTFLIPRAGHYVTCDRRADPPHIISRHCLRGCSVLQFIEAHLSKAVSKLQDEMKLKVNRWLLRIQSRHSSTWWNFSSSSSNQHQSDERSDKRGGSWYLNSLTKPIIFQCHSSHTSTSTVTTQQTIEKWLKVVNQLIFFYFSLARTRLRNLFSLSAKFHAQRKFT